MQMLIISLLFWLGLGTGSQPALSDSLQVLLIHGGRALNQKEYAKARDLYDAAYKLDSNNVEVLRNLAILLATAGDHRNALKILQRAEQLNPTDPSVMNNLGTTYSVLNDPNKAADYFQKAVNAKPNNPTYLTNLALEFAKIGKMTEALATARKAAPLDTASVDLPIIMGDCFMASRQYDSADFYYSRTLGMGARTAELFYLRGLARQNLKRLDDAELDLKTSVSIDSTCRDCRQTYGVVLVQKGHYEEALVQFARVVQLDSAFYPGWISLGVMYSMAGFPDQADSVLVKLMKVDSAMGFKMVDLINLENSKRKAKK